VPSLSQRATFSRAFQTKLIVNAADRSERIDPCIAKARLRNSGIERGLLPDQPPTLKPPLRLRWDPAFGGAPSTAGEIDILAIVICANAAVSLRRI